MARVSGGDDTQRRCSVHRSVAESVIEGFPLGYVVPIHLPQPDVQRMPVTAWFGASRLCDRIGVGDRPGSL
jgi:hypothetical protein